MAQYDVDLRDYWRILKKRKAIIIIMTILVGGFSYLFAKLKEPTPFFEAETSVKIERRTNLAEFFMGGFWSQSDSISTQALIITSFPVLIETAKYLGWIPANTTETDIQNTKHYLLAVERLKGMIRSVQEGNTNVLNIYVTSDKAQEAAEVANAVAAAYRIYNIQEKNKQTFETKSFIEEQLRMTEEQLKKAEEALRAFKESSNLLILDTQTQNTLNRMFSVEAEYEKVKREREIVAAQLGAAEKAGGSIDEYEGIFISGTEDPSVQDLNKGLRDLVMKRKTLLFDFTEAHPQVMETNDQIRGILYGIRKELGSRLGVLSSLEVDLAEKLILLKSEINKFPENGLKLSQLQREVTLQESLYSQLKTKYQEILIQAAGKVEEVAILQPAAVPSYPVNIPSKLSVIATGIIMGIIMGIVFAFVAEALDTSIGTIEDVESLLNVSVLGVIPSIEREKKDSEDKRTRDIITHFEPDALVSEAFRSIRSNLRALEPQMKNKVLLVTSSFLQEGKTFNITNIAVSLAQDGTRTLLVDADLRNPTVNRVLGLDKSPGLTDYVLGSYRQTEIIYTVTDLMLGEIDIDEILMTPGLDNLHYITAGSSTSSPSEILRSKEFQELIRSVRTNYDIVLIDAPPILPVSDAADIAPYADGVILVYTVGKIGRGALKRAKATLDNVNAKVIGVILNNVKPETGPEYFKYQGRYSSHTQSNISSRSWGMISQKPDKKRMKKFSVLP